MTTGRLLRLYTSVLVSLLFSSGSAFLSRSQRRVPWSTHLGAKQPHAKYKNLEDMIDSLEHETVLVAFMSGNCGPCKIQKQELATLAQRGESLKMLRIDMNQFPKLGTKFNIGKLPCILVLKNKEVIMRADGLITAQDLWDQVQLLLPQQKKNT